MQDAAGRKGSQARDQQRVGAVGGATDLVPAGRRDDKGKVAHDEILVRWNSASAAISGRKTPDGHSSRPVTQSYISGSLSSSNAA